MSRCRYYPILIVLLQPVLGSLLNSAFDLHGRLKIDLTCDRLVCLFQNHELLLSLKRIYWHNRLAFEPYDAVLITFWEIWSHKVPQATQLLWLLIQVSVVRIAVGNLG